MDSQASSTGANASSNIITYSDECATSAGDCTCIELQNRKDTLSSGQTVAQSIDFGTAVEISILSAPAWVQAQSIGTTVSLAGTAPIGQHTLVFQISNECSMACWVVILNVSQVCQSAPNNIIADIAYKTSDDSVFIDIEIAPNSKIVSGGSFAGIYASISDNVINWSGTITQPAPATYLINLKNECGAYTLTGNVVPCVVPKIVQVTGNSVLELNVAGTLGWVVEATGIVSIKSVTGLPAGMSVAVQQAIPVAGKATIIASGTPSENPCSSSSCEIVIVAKAACGEIEINRKFTQQPCRQIQVVSETGTGSLIIGQPATYCKILAGYDPSIVDFSDVPMGMTVTLEPHTVAGQWKLCVTGTPIIDPCATSDGGLICSCAKIKLKNACGEKEIELCSNLTAVPRPTYCVASVRKSLQGASVLYEIIGAIPNSEATLSVGPFPNQIPATVLIDSTGYGSYSVPNNGTQPACVSITHPTCSLVSNSITFNCNSGNGGGTDTGGGTGDGTGGGTGTGGTGTGGTGTGTGGATPGDGGLGGP